MPHQCTTCERTFPDGSKQMLDGCPDCGGNKFQFIPSGVAGADRDSPSAPVAGESPTETTTDRSRPAGEDSDATTVGGQAREDNAQASARRAVVSEDELPPTDHRSVDVADDGPGEEDDRPELEDLRAELNDQFESIKILRPGEYELNLMELYDRDEYIVALEEDGRYVIDVPNSWREE